MQTSICSKMETSEKISHVNHDPVTYSVCGLDYIKLDITSFDTLRLHKNLEENLCKDNLNITNMTPTQKVLCSALCYKRNLVVCGPPKCGKKTAVRLFLLNTILENTKRTNVLVIANSDKNASLTVKEITTMVDNCNIRVEKFSPEWGNEASTLLSNSYLEKNLPEVLVTTVEKLCSNFVESLTQDIFLSPVSRVWNTYSYVVYENIHIIREMELFEFLYSKAKLKSPCSTIFIVIRNYSLNIKVFLNQITLNICPKKEIEIQQSLNNGLKSNKETSDSRPKNKMSQKKPRKRASKNSRKTAICTEYSIVKELNVGQAALNDSQLTQSAEVESNGIANYDIDQRVFPVCGPTLKLLFLKILIEQLRTENVDSKEYILVFVNYRKMIKRLKKQLLEYNIEAGEWCSTMNQSKREKTIDDLRVRNSNVHVIITTSVSARGFDIAGVRYVINYDLPQVTKYKGCNNDEYTCIREYVLRIGRTGRCGNKGYAISFFDQDVDNRLARGLISVLAECLMEVPEFLQEIAYKQIGGQTVSSNEHRFLGFGDMGRKKHKWN